jgi:hypothetical protein
VKCQSRHATFDKASAIKIAGLSHELLASVSPRDTNAAMHQSADPESSELCSLQFKTGVPIKISIGSVPPQTISARHRRTNGANISFKNSVIQGIAVESDNPLRSIIESRAGSLSAAFACRDALVCAVSSFSLVMKRNKIGMLRLKGHLASLGPDSASTLQHASILRSLDLRYRFDWRKRTTLPSRARSIS